MKRIWFFLFVLISPHWILADISWGSPTQISASSVDASQPVIVQDSNGNATGIWIEGTSLISKSLPSGGSWSSAATLTTVAPSSLQLAVDGSGNVMALWIESDTIVYAAFHPFGGSWGTKVAISDVGAAQARLSMNSNGDAVAIWSRNLFIESAVRPSGGSWSLVSTLSGNGIDDYPDVALGATGSMVAVWHTVDAGTHTIHYANGNALGSWNPENTVLSQPIPTILNNYPRVAIDENGVVTAVWFQYSVDFPIFSTVQLLTASLQVGSSTWSDQIALSGTGLLDPALLQSQVHYDGSGNIIALWTNSYDGKTFAIESAVMPLGKGWLTGGNLTLQNLYAYQGDLAVDATGHVVAAGMMYDSTNVIVNAAETDITNPQPNFYSNLITLSTGTGNAYPRVAFSTQGSTLNAIVVWEGFDGTNTIINAAIGNRAVIAPPTSLSVVQTSNDFGTFTEYVNTLSWTASTSPNISEYAIFRNGFQVGATDASTTTFVFDNAVQDGLVRYGILAIDTANAQSTMATP